MSPQQPLRLWPGAALAILQLLIMAGAPIVAPDAELPIGLFGGLICAALILGWWLLFSRAPWSERVGAIVLMIVAVLGMRVVAHFSMVGAGQGMLIFILPVIFLSPALVIWAVLTRHLQDSSRRVALVAAMLITITPFALIRTAGVGGGGFGFHWRWTPTPEERLLAEVNDEPATPPAPLVETPAEPVASKPTEKSRDTAKTANAVPPGSGPAVTTEPAAPAKAEASSVAKTEPAVRRAEWPGFRGPARDGVIHGVHIKTDWSVSPPAEIWRRPIGPAWSSFAVQGDLIYTQEQRGDDEIVSCYKLSTGEPVWRHRDRARFWESNGGAGPRATPTLSNGRAYTHGATGIVNALDARTGALIWSRNTATDTGKEVPYWGLASSPLVVDDLLIIAVAGQLIAYEAASGRPRWTGEAGGAGYSSPHFATLDGVPQVLMMRGARTISVSPADGKLLWDHSTGQPSASMVQPALTADGSVLVAGGDAMGGLGIRRLAVTHGPTGWSAQERWASRGLKPNFSDFAVHKGHAFGFDGTIMSCIDLENGERKWKGGRYGNGQLVLLPDQDLLLVLSEEGELVLVSATAEKFTEVGRFPAINGKTWNHPVIVGSTLLVRNGEEMAAFRLTLAPPLSSTATPSSPR